MVVVHWSNVYNCYYVKISNFNFKAVISILELSHLSLRLVWTFDVDL